MDFSYFQNDFLKQLKSSPLAHSVWVKTLSYLEYIGYRKMVKSLGYDDVNPSVFHHLSDEIRHSYMLRESAEKHFAEYKELSTPQLNSFYHHAENYFQSLDSQIDNWIEEALGEKKAKLAYMWVSYVIEKRAMQVYPLYQKQFEDSPLKTLLAKVIDDEFHHLKFLEESILGLPKPMKLEKFPLFEKETELFCKLMQNFETEIKLLT